VDTLNSAASPVREPPSHATKTPWGALFEARDFFRFLGELEAKYGAVVRTRIAHQHVFLRSGPSEVDAFLTTSVADFGKDTPGFRAMRKVLGMGLITADGEPWKRNRRTLAPAFRRDKVELLAQQMDHLAEKEVNERLGSEVELFSFFSDLTLRILAKTLLALDISDSSHAVHDDMTTLMSEATRRVLHPSWFPDWVPTPANGRFRAARQRLRETVEKIVAAQCQNPEGGSEVLRALLAARDPQTGESMTQEQIVDELITLLLAGHETQAIALTWTAALLQEHPSERRNLLASFGTASERQAIDAVLNESMRLYPPVWMVGRRALRDTTVADISIPSRAIVLVSPYAVHRSQRLYSNPHAFQPDRWTELKPPRGAFLPFSLGPRKCIGDHLAMLSMRSILRAIYCRAGFQFTKPPEFEFEAGVTLRPAKPLTARLVVAPTNSL
jgi:cytochrome P450